MVRYLPVDFRSWPYGLRGYSLLENKQPRSQAPVLFVSQSTGVVTMQRWLRWRVIHDEITVASHLLDCKFKNGLVAVNSKTWLFWEIEKPSQYAASRLPDQCTFSYYIMKWPGDEAISAYGLCSFSYIKWLHIITKELMNDPWYR